MRQTPPLEGEEGVRHDYFPPEKWDPYPDQVPLTQYLALLLLALQGPHKVEEGLDGGDPVGAGVE